MPASTEKIKELVIKHLDAELSAAEQQELSDWMNESAVHRQAVEEFLDENKLQKGVKELYGSKERIWKKIEETLPDEKVFPLHRRKIRWIAAASVILLLGTGYFLFVNRESSNLNSKKEVAVIHDIKAPATNRAMITTADGKIIYLDSASNGRLATQNNIALIKTDDGKIIYESSPLKANPDSDRDQPIAVSYNTLTNPRGSKVIDMTLSDGSHVWLNAGSSITYPVVFVGNERKLSITGEAYFEVKHYDKMPFTVSANGVEVHDIGTSFNINAYDEDATRVTLIEGSVKISSIKTHDSRMIKPGEQALYKVSSQQLTANSSVDLDEVLAWKNGIFNFNEQAITTIMKEVSRWYDVEIVYEGVKPDDLFSGIVKRDNNVSQVLNKLQETNRVHFRVENRKVIVSK